MAFPRQQRFRTGKNLDSFLVILYTDMTLGLEIIKDKFRNKGTSNRHELDRPPLLDRVQIWNWTWSPASQTWSLFSDSSWTTYPQTSVKGITGPSKFIRNHLLLRNGKLSHLSDLSYKARVCEQGNRGLRKHSKKQRQRASPWQCFLYLHVTVCKYSCEWNNPEVL